MRLLEAIALSNGNKAQGINDHGQTVVIQERYSSINDCWYHAWRLHGETVSTFDIPDGNLAALKQFEIDYAEDYWSPVQ